MRAFRFVPDKTHIDFMRYRILCLAASVVAIVVSAILAFYPGPNYGIDFEGGILMEVQTPGPADIAAMRDRLTALDLGGVALQEFGAEDDVLIRVQRQEGDDAAQQAAVTQVRAAVDDLYANEGAVDYRRVEYVGPKVSDELLRDGLMAVGFSLIAVLIYVWFRFEWQYGIGAIAALLHDVFATVGFFVLTGLEVNLTTVAAILTIVGYSLNDTVVIFDRVRENLRRYKTMPMVDLLNASVNETLARTVMTSGTTLVALLALFIFGGEVIRGFTAAMIWGVLIGTYSTVYIATPILLYLNLRREQAETAPAPGAKAAKIPAKPGAKAGAN